jgi:hypothetical protein
MLPLGASYLLSKRLVSQVVGTQGIAVQEKYWRSIDLDPGRIDKNLQTGLTRETFADQKIPVAVHEEYLRAGIGKASQPLRHIACERITVELVVADPILEQITQNVEGAGSGSSFCDEALEDLRDVRAFCAQVKIGNKKSWAHDMTQCAQSLKPALRTDVSMRWVPG